MMRDCTRVILRIVSAAMLALAASVHAQDSKPDPAQAAMAEFYDCTRSYSEKYSRSREPAQDIADAALSFCEVPRERARTLLIDKLSVGGRSALKGRITATNILLQIECHSRRAITYRQTALPASDDYRRLIADGFRLRLSARGVVCQVFGSAFEEGATVC